MCFDSMLVILKMRLIETSMRYAISVKQKSTQILLLSFLFPTLILTNIYIIKQSPRSNKEDINFSAIEIANAVRMCVSLR